jgi:hypothetical protein
MYRNIIIYFQYSKNLRIKIILQMISCNDKKKLKINVHSYLNIFFLQVLDFK